MDDFHIEMFVLFTTRQAYLEIENNNAERHLLRLYIHSLLHLLVE